MRKRPEDYPEPPSPNPHIAELERRWDVARYGWDDRPLVEQLTDRGLLRGPYLPPADPADLVDVLLWELERDGHLEPGSARELAPVLRKRLGR